MSARRRTPAELKALADKAAVALEDASADGDPGTGLDGARVQQVQSALLPPSLPLLPDSRVSGSYERATSADAAGGDWYDAVPLGAGRLALVIGDAVGSGAPAAGTPWPTASPATSANRPAPSGTASYQSPPAERADVAGW